MGGGHADEDRNAACRVRAPVEAEDELVEIGLEVLAAQTVADPQGPDLEVQEDAMEDDMCGHLGETCGAGIAGPSVGLGGGTSGEVGGEEGVQAAGRLIGHLAHPNAVVPGTTILSTAPTTSILPWWLRPAFLSRD